MRELWLLLLQFWRKWVWCSGKTIAPYMEPTARASCRNFGVLRFYQKFLESGNIRSKKMLTSF